MEIIGLSEQRHLPARHLVDPFRGDDLMPMPGATVQHEFADLRHIARGSRSNPPDAAKSPFGARTMPNPHP